MGIKRGECGFFFFSCCVQYCVLFLLLIPAVVVGVKGKKGWGSEEEEGCDLFTGKWVVDESYPLYRPDTCPFIEREFRCEANGRPDLIYTHYRWYPLACNLLRFVGSNPTQPPYHYPYPLIGSFSLLLSLSNLQFFYIKNNNCWLSITFH